MSIFVMQTMTGTFSARAIPRCSLFTALVTVDLLIRTRLTYLLIPTRPLLAATINKQ